MADIGKTQAQWTKLLGRECGIFIFAVLRILKELEHRFRRQREQVLVVRDYSSFLDDAGGGATFSGANPGVNCTEAGEVYVRLVANGGDWDVSVYKATGAGGGDLVASDTAVADGATATLAAANSSGLTGTWVLPATVVATTGDELKVRIMPDFQALLTTVFDATDEDDRFSQNVFQSLLASLAVQMAALRRRYVSSLTAFLLTARDNPTARGSAFLGRQYATQISETVTNSNGTVTRTRTGFWPALKAAMEDETTGGEQFVLQNTYGTPSVTFRGNNGGQGTISTWTPGQGATSCTIELQCVRGIDTEDLGEEEFSGSVTVTEDGEERRIPLGQPVRVGKDYDLPRDLGTIRINRTMAKTGDGSNNIFAAASAAVVSGERNGNTDEGVLYWEVVTSTTNASNWDVKFYKSSTRSASSLVAQATNVATSATFTADVANANGALRIDWQLGGTITTGDAGTLDLQGFRATNSNNVPDTIDIVITRATAGLIQALVADEINRDVGASLNGAASGSVTIPDDFAKVGTFADFSVQDN